jgi:hypothetical protein
MRCDEGSCCGRGGGAARAGHTTGEPTTEVHAELGWIGCDETKYEGVAGCVGAQHAREGRAGRAGIAKRARGADGKGGDARKGRLASASACPQRRQQRPAAKSKLRQRRVCTAS